MADRYRKLSEISAKDKCVATVRMALNTEPPMITAAVQALKEFTAECRYKTELDEPITMQTLVNDPRVGFGIRILNYLDKLQPDMTIGQLLDYGPEELSKYHHMPVNEIENALKLVGLTLRKNKVSQLATVNVSRRADLYVSAKPIHSGWYWVLNAKGEEQIVFLDVRNSDKWRWKMYAGPIKSPKV